MNRLQIDILKHGDLVEFVCSGDMDYENTLALGQRVEEEMKTEPSLDNVLIDVSRAQVKVNMMERFRLGEYVAKNLPHLKIATIARAGDINKMVEDTAVNRGASMYVTDDREDAVTWLREG